MVTPSDPIAYLRRLLAAGNHNDVVQMIRDRDTAIARWAEAFRDPDQLDVDTFSQFLEFEHNRHWWGLQRRRDPLVRWFPAVRAMIGELLDSSRSIENRINGLGQPWEFDQEVWSPILLVTHPSTYGVWNGISESAMRRLGLWPEATGDASPGETYVAVNDMLHLVRSELDTDLWTLDALWWAAEKEHDPTRHFTARKSTRTPAPRVSPVQRTKVAQARKARAVATEDTFVCQSCWTTKPIRLASDDPSTCIDCA